MFTYAHAFIITYRVDVYRSRPIGASLLTTSPKQECLALNGLHTGWLGVVTGIRLIRSRLGALQRVEMRMVRWMCDVKVKDKSQVKS